MKFITVLFTIALVSTSIAHAETKNAETKKILIMGDSFTAGYGLEENESLPIVLEHTLNEMGADVETINAGVSGDTSFSGLSRAMTTFEQDHDFVVLELGTNDMLRGIDPEITRENLAEIIALSEKPVFLLGMRAFPSYGQDYVEAFDAIYPGLAETYQTGFYPFIFASLFDENDQISWQYFQADRLHPNAVGVEKIAQDLSPVLMDWLIGQSD